MLVDHPAFLPGLARATHSVFHCIRCIDKACPSVQSLLTNLTFSFGSIFALDLNHRNFTYAKLVHKACPDKHISVRLHKEMISLWRKNRDAPGNDSAVIDDKSVQNPDRILAVLRLIIGLPEKDAVSSLNKIRYGQHNTLAKADVDSCVLFCSRYDFRTHPIWKQILPTNPPYTFAKYIANVLGATLHGKVTIHRWTVDTWKEEVDRFETLFSHVLADYATSSWFDAAASSSQDQDIIN